MSQYIQPYDFVMLAVLVASVLFGAWKGVAWQVAAVASVVVSAGVAVHCSASVTPYLTVSTHEPWNRFLAMLVLYVVTAGAIWILFRLISNAINRVQLKEFDRQLGVLFGFAKGVLYCVIITFFAVTLSEAARQLVLQSHSGDLIARGIRRATPILPDDVREWLGEYIDELDKKLHAPPVEGPKNPDAAGVANGPSGTGNGRGAPPATVSETDRKIQDVEQHLKKVFEPSK